MNNEGTAQDICAETVPCTIYMIYGAGRVKIGRTIDLKERHAALQRMSPVPLTVVWDRSELPEVETELHQRFGEDRLHGEWFRISPDIRAFLRGQDLFNRKRKVPSEKLLEACEREWIETLNEHQRGWNGCLAHVQQVLSNLVASMAPPEEQPPRPAPEPPRPTAPVVTSLGVQALVNKLGLGVA